MKFDGNIEREKSSNGKRAIEAITEAYLFSAAFPFVTGKSEGNESGLPYKAGIDLDGCRDIIQPAAEIKSAS